VATCGGIAIGLLCASIGYGFYRLDHAPFAEGPVVSSLQGNVAQNTKLTDRGPLFHEYAGLHLVALGPIDGDPIRIANLAKAIAAFERTLISGNSPYDRYVYQHDDDALSESAKRGMGFFFSEFLECDHCHGGLTFASALQHDGSPRDTVPFENNGLYNVGGTGAYPEPNTGLFAFTGQPRDMGRMKPPSLRNIALTAPYMHDGSIATLAEVVDHYARGGRLITSGPNAGDGALNPNKSQFVTGFPFAAQPTPQP
jgi:cytochrome c peroxidase